MGEVWKGIESGLGVIGTGGRDVKKGFDDGVKEMEWEIKGNEWK